MKPKTRPAAKECLLQFAEDFSNLEDLRTEISSCLITGDNLWLSMDEEAGIERLSKTKNGFGYHKHYELTDFFDLPAADAEVDMEALAYEAPYLWFCGSMSLKRDAPDPDDPLEEQLDDLADIDLDKNRFSLGCIPCLETDGRFELLREARHEGQLLQPMMMRGGSRSTELHNALHRDPHLRKFMDIPCKDNGFDIEGLAVYKGRIFVGLRGPVLNGYAVILEIGCKELDSQLIMVPREGEELLYRKHFVDLAGMGIRELNISENGDLFLLAGPTMDLDGTISIYYIKGGLPDTYSSVTHTPERLFDVSRGSELRHGEDKAEGMALLPSGEVLITYDSPAPHRLQGKDAVIMDIYDFDQGLL